ncbi:MAG: S8 family serine peptidase [Chthoniobacterales bacterium]
MNNQKIQKHGHVYQLVLLPALAAAASVCLPIASLYAQGEKISEHMQQQIVALDQEKAARTPVQRKMASQLVFATREQRDGAALRALPTLKSGLQLEKDGRANVDIVAPVTDGLLGAIRAAGGEIINAVPEESAIRALLPVSAAESIAAREDVTFIRPADLAFSNSGSVNSQGDVTHNSNKTRIDHPTANGAGVKVGVLSTSINNNVNSFGQAKQSGDMDPNNTFVLAGQAGTANAKGGEGLAMLEIVHDLAPAAQLYFATGFSGQAQMAQNIRNLAAAGCRVIIDDIGYFAETPFQDGTIAKAITDVSAQGVLYFSSAANSGNLQSGNSGTWEGNFVKGGSVNGFGQYHKFKRGVVIDRVTQGGGSPTYLFWSDPLGASGNDYDIFVFDAFDNMVSAGNDSQTGTQDPIEFVPAPQQGEQIVIYKFSGQIRCLHLNTNRARLAVGTSGNTKGHNASGADNAFCVAAAPAAAHDGPGSPNGPFPNPFNSSNKVENFSSDGFRRIFFKANGDPITPGNLKVPGGQVLLKPDITAADGVVTTLPSNSGLNPFFGTSAAAPHAGAIAAQLLSFRPSSTPNQIRLALNASAIDILTRGIDRASGRGIVMAPKALNSLVNMPFAVPGSIEPEVTDDLPIALEPDEDEIFAPGAEQAN